MSQDVNFTYRLDGLKLPVVTQLKALSASELVPCLLGKE